MTAAETSILDAAVGKVHAALSAQQIDRAIDIAEAALADGVADPLLLNLAAHRRQVAGRFGEALALLERAQDLAPGDVFILCAIGSNLSQQGLEAQALDVYDRALALNARHAPAHHGRGLALGAQGDALGAWRAHARAVELAPDYPDALGALADHAVRAGEHDTARRYAQRALAADPHEPASVLTLAFLDLRDGAADVAVARLETRLRHGGLAPLHLSAFEALLAEALDALDRPQEAFAAHVRSNDAVWSVHQPLFVRSGVETGTQICRRLTVYFERARPEDWTAAPSRHTADEAPDVHVFLVGFVRSGTTLLEQVLASHPRVVALEEQPLLRGLAQDYFRDEAGLDRLAALDANAADALRCEYWAKVRGSGVEPHGRVFVDKNPLDAIWLPLAAKLFPDARIVMARRDPRDVVVSTFRHRFMVNALTCAFTGLERAAEFYSEVMTLAARLAERLPLATFVHRHETLVDDFDREVQAICRFIGIDWNEAMRDFAATARRRDIRTPSADQVRQGLSREGLGRWRRYEDSVQPILPVLAPWVEAFGYEP